MYQSAGRSSTSDWKVKNASIWEEEMHYVKKKKCIILVRKNTPEWKERLEKRNTTDREEKVHQTMGRRNASVREENSSSDCGKQEGID